MVLFLHGRVACPLAVVTGKCSKRQHCDTGRLSSSTNVTMD